mgnify:CR=1 FL=1
MVNGTRLCVGCGKVLSGKQHKWCSPACGQRHRNAGRVCKADGCTRLAVSAQPGLCRKHSLAGRVCKADGCTRLAVSAQHGLCQKHSLAGRVCNVDGCTNTAETVQPGWCETHGKRFRDHGSFDDLCGRCGASLGTGTNGRWVCDECLAQRYTENHLLRADIIRNGDDITLAVLGERDGWICSICHKKVVVRSGRTRKSASIDHVIPLCEGGTHTWPNVALAHKGCNSAKGRRGTSQLRLV